MKITRPEHVVVLGGGPAGLAVAHELSTNGIRVTVLERNRYVGGLAATFEYKGYKFDLGGHRWFTKNDALNHWFRRLMEGELVLVNRISRIYHKGTYFSYPIRLKEMLTKCDPVTIVRILASFLWSSLKQAAINQPVVTMEQAYTQQFGEMLYRMFFQQYSEKVWGAPCPEISADWVAQRSRGLSIWDLARDALLKPRKDIVSLVDQFMYPREGYGRISERMAEDVRATGNEVILGCPVTRIAYRGPGELEVLYLRGDEELSLNVDNVVSTVPLGRLVLMLEPACDPVVVEAARSLSFRDLITVNLILRKGQVSDDTWLYVQDSEILFGRMHEPKNWSRDMVRDDDHTSLVLECFCSEGDHIWTMSDEEIGRSCIEDLCEKLNFIEEGDVEDVKVIRTRFAYPVYDLRYREKLSLIQNHLQGYVGLHTVGRSGTFRYNNADHSIEMGLMLARRLRGEDIDHMLVNTEAEYHEEKRVEPPNSIRPQVPGRV
ncbi:MAG: FAD-dependent oxidoreductase [Methyloceanibacter sp.]